MQSAAIAYPFDKGMMLNVIYDTLDRLGVTAISSNSEQGRVRLRMNGVELALIIDTVYPQGTVSVTVGSSVGEADRDLADALLDEINSTILQTKAADRLPD